MEHKFEVFEIGYGPFFATTDLLGLEVEKKPAARMYIKIVAHGITGSILAGVLPPVIGAGFNASAKIGAATSREVGLGVPGSVIGAGVAAFDSGTRKKT